MRGLALVILSGCHAEGLTSFADDFEDHATTGDLLAQWPEAGWSQHLTVEGSRVDLTSERAHGGRQAARFEAQPSEEAGLTSKASLFINDLALKQGTTVILSAWYWLEAGREPFLLDLEEDTPVGTGPGIRVALDAHDRLWIERRKYGQPPIHQDPEDAVAFPRDAWIQLQLEVVLSQRRDGTITLYQDGEVVIREEGTKTLPTDILYVVQGTRGLYTNGEIGLTAAGPDPARLFVDDVVISTR